MNTTASLYFCPSTALNLSKYSAHVEHSRMQHKLNITSKKRTSVLPWRGQFSPELIEYLLDEAGQHARTILDPFCGSGTVNYEAAHKKKASLSFDINPAAVCLARISEVCKIAPKERFKIIKKFEYFIEILIQTSSKNKGTLSLDSAIEIVKKNEYDIPIELQEAFLLLIFGNNNDIVTAKIAKYSSTYKDTLLNIPYFDGNITVSMGDARYLTGVKSGSIDFIVTSPPYINVFNYHQNYRPVVEALGYKPLHASKAELGANRKFRQNRYMTVIQYCMDMALFFVESARILSENGKMTIVIGRESSVRGVSFKNGELIAAIASEGMGWRIKKWNERVFTNRFGEKIVEDVITLISKTFAPDAAIQVGNLVGCESLHRALNNAPHPQNTEIESAIQAAKSIKPSPKLAVKND